MSWLDEIQGERALRWVREQNARTARLLGNSARFQANYERARAVHLDQDALPLANGTMIHEGWVYEVLRDASHPRGLWRRTRLQALLDGSVEWERLIDVTALAEAEGHPLSLTTPVHCLGKRCLVKMEGGPGVGARNLDVREFDLTTRSFVRGGFTRPPRLNWVMWKDADTVFLVDDFEAAALSQRQSPIQVREWRRGAEPDKEIFRGDPTGSFGVYPIPRPSTDTGKLWTIVSDERDSTRNYLIERDGRVLPNALPDRTMVLGEYREQIIVQLSGDEPWSVGGRRIRSGSLVSIPRAEFSHERPTVQTILEPHERESIAGNGVAITSAGVLVAAYRNVRARLIAFTLEGGRWVGHDIGLPDHGSVFLKGSDPAEPTALVSFESFVRPPTMYAVDVGRLQARPLMHGPKQFDESSLLVEQHEAASKDGTRVPYFVVRHRSAELDGGTPLLLYAYGAAGAARTPHYDAGLGKLWLEQGGAYALANVRGGGEFGPAWHVRRMDRKRTYEDFIAVAEDLISRGITSPRHLGIRGHSNGGLLVGVSLNTRPELFNAAVIEHPVLDLFVHTRGVDSKEYGAWSDAEERAFLESTSPLQNLRRRPGFPVPLLKTATNDSVFPTPARQYAARLAAFDMPFYFFESPGGRHNTWETPQDAAYYEALLYTYLADRLM